MLAMIAGISPAAAGDVKLDLQEKSILVYTSVSGDQENQFVIRIARFLPDRVFEWETTAFQGTVHLHRAAVESAETLTYGRLFEAGVGFETSDTITKWLSNTMYHEIKKGSPVKFKLNQMKAEFVLEGTETFTLLLDGKEIQVPAIRIKDSRRGTWLFQDSPDNPVLLKYVSPYFREELKRVSNDADNRLRWLRKVPPVN